MAECFVSPALKTHMESWVSRWDGAKIAPTKKWLESQVGGVKSNLPCPLSLFDDETVALLLNTAVNGMLP